MENVKEFLKAALPFVAMGLALAILIANRSRKKKGKEGIGNYSTVGLCIGMVVGMAINPDYGMSPGMPVGLVRMRVKNGYATILVHGVPNLFMI